MTADEIRHLLSFTHRLARRLIEHAATAGDGHLMESFAESLRTRG